ncbi:hypothetical protein [Pseudomonas amygdali]|uniref:Uncharacterized protein n=2 Tax=Pseudomonas amygdali pv. lachrymans TaxID=53707 RepID=A0ABR5KSF4_PSEAV|nr:hypothetical protein [Pseudomonas amygdali]AXH60331.1 hypothetical protein PLA107_034685 [Pseudomonas amygdali pv. lachrymans str. M301315]KPC17719.1 Uncharacterized protein AC499_0921 [Pseudomonas amygdali pv. lachrymans]RMT06438.1 hypothetical protein ALP54_04141 [Pseudomonas amygdali pv. lachrymans]
MSNGHIKQHAFPINMDEIVHGGFTLVDIKSHPFKHPKELMSVVNQAGVIKLHCPVDINQQQVTSQIAVVGTGSTIPSEIIDRLYKIGNILVGDSRFGYHIYLVSELRGIVENGSDAGLKPVFSVKVSLDVYDLNARDVLEDYVDGFCEAHPSVIRAHKEELDNGVLELFVYNNEFRHQPEFTKLMAYLFTAKGATNVTVNNGV